MASVKWKYKSGEPDVAQQARGIMGGRVVKLPYRFRTTDIAKASQQSLWKVRKAIRTGALNPKCLVSLSEYIVRYRHTAGK